VSSGVALFGVAQPLAKVPFVVEVWAEEGTEMRLIVCVNRTPVTGDVFAARNKRKINVFG
jgi:hypothetical protein